MKQLFKLKAVALFVMAFLVSTIAFGQGKQQASPADSASGTAAGSMIKISYHSPSVKGRKIWGGLVPYDKVWRTGANEATIFTTSKAIKIGGKTLPAGKVLPPILISLLVVKIVASLAPVLQTLS